MGTKKLMMAALSVAGMAMGSAQASDKEVYRFMEDNNLHLQDSGFAANMTQEEFEAIIDAAYAIYAPAAKAKGEVLKINAKWSDSTVNANCGRNFGTVTVNMYGGMARRPEVTPDAFALVLCHELGHAYGGAPYIRAASEMSAEGQADYYGAQTCLKSLLPKIEATGEEPSDYIANKCARASNSSLCERQLMAGEHLGTLLSTMKNERTPDYETPDKSVVSRTELSYPKTVQCRLDTYQAGSLGLARPACWFKN
jgi:hypothetical protein